MRLLRHDQQPTCCTWMARSQPFLLLFTFWLLGHFARVVLNFSNRLDFSRSTRRPSLHDPELSTSRRSKFTLSRSCNASGIAGALVKRRYSQSRFSWIPDDWTFDSTSFSSNLNLKQAYHRALLTFLSQSYFQLHTRSCHNHRRFRFQLRSALCPARNFRSRSNQTIRTDSKSIENQLANHARSTNVSVFVTWSARNDDSLLHGTLMRSWEQLHRSPHWFE